MNQSFRIMNLFPGFYYRVFYISFDPGEMYVERKDLTTSWCRENANGYFLFYIINTFCFSFFLILYVQTMEWNMSNTLRYSG